MTPPRLTTSPQEAAEIARVTLERLRSLSIDGLVLYDIDDESDRNPDERPFPFLPTMDPADYLARDLAQLEVPAIVYRAVGKYREDRFRSWLEEQDPSQALAVFVGSSSREKAVHTSLARAYELRYADDTLDASYEQAVATAIDLIAFCRRLGVPFGLNVESVSIRKVEIEASVRLAARLGAELRR